MEFPSITHDGFMAYLNGCRDKNEAKLSNPFKGFGSDRLEHIKYVSWNKGWNNAARLDREGLL